METIKKIISYPIGLLLEKKSEGKYTAEINEGIKNEFCGSKILLVIVIGKTRNGKSTLLNYLLNNKLGRIIDGEFKKKDQKNLIFEAKPGDKSTTKGMNIASIMAKDFQKMHFSDNIKKGEMQEIKDDYKIIFIDTEGLGASDVSKGTKVFLNGLISLLGICPLIIDLSYDPIENISRQNELGANIFLKKVSDDDHILKEFTYLILHRALTFTYSQNDKDQLEDLDIDNEEDHEAIKKIRYKAYKEYEQRVREKFLKNMEEKFCLDENDYKTMVIPHIGDKISFDHFKMALKDIAQLILSFKDIQDGTKCYETFIERTENLKNSYGEEIDDTQIEDIFKKFLKYKLNKVREDHLFFIKASILEELRKMIPPSFVDQFGAFGLIKLVTFHFFNSLFDWNMNQPDFGKRLDTESKIKFLKSKYLIMSDLEKGMNEIMKKKIPLLKDLNAYPELKQLYLEKIEKEIDTEIKNDVTGFEENEEIFLDTQEFLKKENKNDYPFVPKNKLYFPKGLKIFKETIIKKKKFYLRLFSGKEKIVGKNEIEITDEFNFNPIKYKLVANPSINQIKSTCEADGFFSADYTIIKETVKFIFNETELRNEKNKLVFMNNEITYEISPEIATWSNEKNTIIMVDIRLQLKENH